MLMLLSPIDYCQGIRRERGTLLLVLFFVKHEVYADIDVPLKYHDERLTLDVIAERRSADNNRQRSADNNPTPDRAERLIYWIPRSRLREDFAQFCLLGSLTVPLATLSAGRQASHFFLYCTYFYFNLIFWLVSNPLARTSLSLGSPSVYPCPFAVSKA